VLKQSRQFHSNAHGAAVDAGFHFPCFIRCIVKLPSFAEGGAILCRNEGPELDQLA